MKSLGSVTCLLRRGWAGLGLGEETCFYLRYIGGDTSVVGHWSIKNRAELVTLLVVPYVQLNNTQ